MLFREWGDGVCTWQQGSSFPSFPFPPFFLKMNFFLVSLKNGFLFTHSLYSHPFSFQLQLSFLLHESSVPGFPKISEQNLSNIGKGDLVPLIYHKQNAEKIFYHQKRTATAASK